MRVCFSCSFVLFLFLFLSNDDESLFNILSISESDDVDNESLPLLLSLPPIITLTLLELLLVLFSEVLEFTILLYISELINTDVSDRSLFNCSTLLLIVDSANLLILFCSFLLIPPINLLREKSDELSVEKVGIVKLLSNNCT